MATMVKEKRREKKKSKEKHNIKTVPPVAANLTLQEDIPSISIVREVTLDDDDLSCSKAVSEEGDSIDIMSEIKSDSLLNPISSTCSEQIIIPEPNMTSSAVKEIRSEQKTDCKAKISAIIGKESNNSSGNEYNELNARLQRIQIPATAKLLTKERETSLEAEGAYIIQHLAKQTSLVTESEIEDYVLENVEDIQQNELVVEDLSPSAPMLDFGDLSVDTQYQEQHTVIAEVPKLICMSLEEAINLYGGMEMAEVMAMSVREEAAVEAGPVSGPEHPLVDLLSTFKRSLLAVDRELSQLETRFAEEEKFRNSLWVIEKQEICHSKTCRDCARTVLFRGKYEVATLQTDKMQVARIRLEGLVKDLQESYCHHQHAAILAYCQIKEYISEIIQSNKGEIREALTLVLQALKLSDSAPPALTSALKEWASVLAASLLDQRDLRQLLFLIHHLFRQNRSVRWAARVISVHVGDSAARALALLDLLLTRPAIDAAVECTGDKEEEWEEVDKDGGGGAVSDGTLRERDMLALLRAFPLRDVVARIVLFTQADIRQARAWSWVEARGGRDVQRACCGVRALLHVLARAAAAHPRYTRLRRKLSRLALHALYALLALHEHARTSYVKEMEEPIQAELEASFAAGVGLLQPDELHRLPAALLSPHAARDYCLPHIVHLHETSPTRVESLSLEMAPLACDVRVGVVAEVAIGRSQDYDLARIVLEFLFTIGVRRNSRQCGGACVAVAQAALPRLLAAHAHLYPAALLLLANTNAVEKLEPVCLSYMRVSGWRPLAAEAVSVCEDWARRCPQLLPTLLKAMDYTPHTGVCLESQLGIGSWLVASAGAEAEEWQWAVLRRLRVHRACWGLPAEAPPPDPLPATPLAKAYALMANSWGHCVPIICSEGVEALCSLAASRVSVAVHCLAPLMLLLAPAHESIALTPRFGDFFASVLSATPSLVQRALRRSSPNGPELLLRLVSQQLADEHCGGVPRATLARAWTAALWRPRILPAVTTLDVAMATHNHCHLDDYAAQLARAQDEESIQQLSQATRLASTAALVCSRSLHALLIRELHSALLPRLLLQLDWQRRHNQRIHVDNALQAIGSQCRSDELVVYRCAEAVLQVPAPQPAALQLWALLLRLLLQRALPDQKNAPPVGPLFFSGLIKSRTLAQLKKRLQEHIAYHQSEWSALTEKSKRAQKPSTSRTVSSESKNVDNFVILPMSIADLTGDSSDSSDPETDTSEEEKTERVDRVKRKQSKEESPAAVEPVSDTPSLIVYHLAATKMLSAYAQWLDDGERSTVASHLADTTRFIPEESMAAAWRRYSASRRIPDSPSEEVEPLPLPSQTLQARPTQQAPPTAFQRAVDILMAIKSRTRRYKHKAIKSPVEDVNFNDSRSLLALVDKHLKTIEKLAQEWSADVSRLSSLDGALWRLVRELRVPRPLPAMAATCPNRCTKLTYSPPGREWCKSIDAENGIKENRASARTVLNRLSRGRPHVAMSAAALLTIARRCSDPKASRAACERVWRVAANVPASCAPAATTLTAFFQLLAEWLTFDGVACGELIARWGGSLSPLQEGLLAALVAPARLPPRHVPALHAALLRAALPARVAFSCLSKFDIAGWANSVDSTEEMLSTLRRAALRWTGSEEADMVAELVDMQCVAACGPGELCGHTCACAQLIADCALPPARAAHLTPAAARVAPLLTFDKLGHLLRDLGVIWWKCRTQFKVKADPKFVEYFPHVGSLLQTLHRAFVAAAVQQSLAPQRVAVFAWSSVVESWGAWVTPHAAPPLLPTTHDSYTAMLRMFHDTIKQVMVDCPGTEEHLLKEMFEWSVQVCLSAQASSSKAQASALLAELVSAPWDRHQWLRGSSLQALVQVCQSGHSEACAWASGCAGAQAAAAWLRDADEALLAARLALLLSLFTSAPLQLPLQLFDEATSLPWHRLPSAALEEALDRFFMEQQGVAVPYHELPQFRVILSASELLRSPQGMLSHSAVSRHKRASCISWTVRANSAPARVQHAPASQRAILQVLAEAAPFLESSEGEIEDLISRAMVILCIEPAAAAVLPVWVSWVRSSHGAVRSGCARAAATLTAFEYFAPLADAALAAYIACSEYGGWAEIPRLWASSPWREAGPLCARGRVHAAYGTLLAHAHAPHAAKAALLQLLPARLHFIDNEVMIAVWICVACRLARECAPAADTAAEAQIAEEGAQIAEERAEIACNVGEVQNALQGVELAGQGRGAAGEVWGAAVALLGSWAEPARRSLLKIVTLHADTDRPTNKHRALCLFAMCVLTNGEEKWCKALEALLPTVGVAAGAMGVSGGRAPHPRRLPRLALLLYPGMEAYFRYELDAAPPDPAEEAVSH